MNDLNEYLRTAKSLDDVNVEQSLNTPEAYDYMSISPEVAHTLLGNKYNTRSKYQLCVDTEVTVVIEYNMEVPETDHRYRTEHILESEDVDSYNDMLQSILLTHHKAPVRTQYDLYEHKKSHWWILPLIFFTICLLIGVGILYFLLNFK